MFGGVEGVFGDPRTERDGESQRPVHRLSINTSLSAPLQRWQEVESAMGTKKADTTDCLFFLSAIVFDARCLARNGGVLRLSA